MFNRGVVYIVIGYIFINGGKKQRKISFYFKHLLKQNKLGISIFLNNQ